MIAARFALYFRGMEDSLLRIHNRMRSSDSIWRKIMLENRLRRQAGDN